MSNEIQKYEQQAPPMSVHDMAQQVRHIQEVMQSLMKKDEHYGRIPGCGDKPTLLKAGAEKLCMTFRLAPQVEEETIPLYDSQVPGHREVRVKVTLHGPSGNVLGQGVGTCSTMEGKYRFRKAEQKCPKCGKETIIKGKQEYGGGWLCYQKKGGCGAKFSDGDPEIENQNMGRAEHDNPADYYNTVLKMAKKRALVDAVLTVTAASDIFTQDIEDMTETINKSGQPVPDGMRPPKAVDDAPTPPPEDEPKLSEPQRKKIWAMLQGQGFDSDDKKRSHVSTIVGRPIESMQDLTKKEASSVIKALDEAKAAPPEQSDIEPF